MNVTIVLTFFDSWERFLLAHLLLLLGLHLMFLVLGAPQHVRILPLVSSFEPGSLLYLGVVFMVKNSNTIA